MDSNENSNKLTQNIGIRFIFAAILSWMLLGFIWNIFYIVKLSPNLSLDSTSFLGVFDFKTKIIIDIIFIILQCVTIFLTYQLGIKKIIKNECETIEKIQSASRKSLIFSIILCTITFISACSTVYNISKASIVIDATKDYYDNYWEEYREEFVDKFSKGEDTGISDKLMNLDSSLENFVDTYQPTNVVSSEIFKDLMIHISLSQIIIYIFIVSFNCLFFNKYLKREEV